MKQSIDVEWGEVFELVKDPSELQALVARRYFRIHVGKLLGAVCKIAMTIAKVPVSMSVNPVEAMKIGAEAVAAIVATLNALQEDMTPGEFIACAILGRDQGSDGCLRGMTATELESEMSFMCTEVPVALLPWYLGLSKEYLEKALLTITPPNSIHGLLLRLTDKKKLVDTELRHDSTVVYSFVDRDVQWKLA